MRCVRLLAALPFTSRVIRVPECARRAIGIFQTGQSVMLPAVEMYRPIPWCSIQAIALVVIDCLALCVVRMITLPRSLMCPVRSHPTSSVTPKASVVLDADWMPARSRQAGTSESQHERSTCRNAPDRDKRKLLTHRYPSPHLPTLEPRRADCNWRLEPVQAFASAGAPLCVSGRPARDGATRVAPCAGFGTSSRPGPGQVPAPRLQHAAGGGFDLWFDRGEA